MYVKNRAYCTVSTFVNIFLHKLLKGSLNDIFDSRFFFSNQFSQAPEYPIRVVSEIFAEIFENKCNHRCQQQRRKMRKILRHNFFLHILLT
jgi:hypothetical protein